MNNTATLIHLVISTLNDIEIKGKENMDKLLGSIEALESVAHLLEAPNVPTEEKEDKNG